MSSQCDEAELVALLPELAEVVAMSDESFASFDEQLRKSVESAQEFDRLLAETLWDTTKAEERMPTVVRGLLALVVEISKRTGGVRDYANVARPGTMIMRTLFGLALSRSLDVVRVRPAEKQGALCVLLLGFAGSSVDDLEVQAKFYQSFGYTVISTSGCCGSPTRIHQRQLVRLAWELQTAFSSGASLLVHACSAHGTGLLNNIISLWEKQMAPFEKLPPLRDRLRGLVLECVGLHPRIGEDTKTAPEDIDIEADLVQDGDHLFINVANNVLSNLCAHFAPEVKYYSLPREVTIFIRRMSPKYTDGWSTVSPGGAELPLFGNANNWFDFDKTTTPPVPRLFLYSVEDKLFPSDMIETSIDFMWESNRKTVIVAEKSIKAPHNKLWETDKKRCSKVVTDFLKKARILPKGMK